MKLMSSDVVPIVTLIMCVQYLIGASFVFVIAIYHDEHPVFSGALQNSLDELLVAGLQLVLFDDHFRQGQHLVDVAQLYQEDKVENLQHFSCGIQHRDL